jgi:RNA recognition motif-containing protein
MNKKLFVGRLPFVFSNDQLRALFIKSGTVVTAVMVPDAKSGRTRGFGFVDMNTEVEAQAAIQAVNGTPLEDKKIWVTLARDKGEAKPISNDRPERRPFGDRPGSSSGNRRPFNDRSGPSSGARRPFSDRSGPPSGERRPFSDRSGPPTGGRRPFSDRSGPPSGERRPFSDRSGPPSGERRPFSDRSGPPSGARRPFSDRSGPPSGERRPFGSSLGFGPKKHFTDSAGGNKNSRGPRPGGPSRGGKPGGRRPPPRA